MEGAVAKLRAVLIFERDPDLVAAAKATFVRTMGLNVVNEPYDKAVFRGACGREQLDFAALVWATPDSVLERWAGQHRVRRLLLPYAVSVLLAAAGGFEPAAVWAAAASTAGGSEPAAAAPSLPLWWLRLDPTLHSLQSLLPTKTQRVLKCGPFSAVLLLAGGLVAKLYPVRPDGMLAAWRILQEWDVVPSLEGEFECSLGHVVLMSWAGDPLELDAAAAAGCREAVTQILLRMHEHGVTHGDVCLQNVVRHPATGRLWLVDLDTMCRAAAAQASNRDDEEDALLLTLGIDRDLQQAAWLPGC